MASLRLATLSCLLASTLAQTPRELVLKGERHCSTHFLAYTLQRNIAGDRCPEPQTMCTASCDCDVDEPTAHTFCCWKHGYVDAACPMRGASTAYAIIERSPYTWLLAMYGNPYEFDGCDISQGCGCFSFPFHESDCWCGAEPSCGNFSNFLRAVYSYTPGPAYGEDYSGHKDVADNAVALWNRKVRYATNYTGLATRLTVNELYDPAAMTQKLAPFIHAANFSLTDEAAAQLSANGTLLYPAWAASEDEWSGKFTYDGYVYARDYEDSLSWLELYTQEDLDFVNEQIDGELLEAWGIPRVRSIDAGSNADAGITDATRADGAAAADPTDPAADHRQAEGALLPPGTAGGGGAAARGPDDHGRSAARWPAADAWRDPNRRVWHYKMLNWGEDRSSADQFMAGVVGAVSL